MNMTRLKKSGGKPFSLVLTVALICLMTAVLIPGVMGNNATAVNLGTAGNYAILAQAGISTTGATDITGNIGVSPAAATTITGFSLIADPSNQFSTSTYVNGSVYAADYAAPTPATLLTAVSDMGTAYTTANGQTPADYTDIGNAGNIGGLILDSGLYKFDTGSPNVVINLSGVTLDAQGNPNAVWVFQIPGTFTTASGTTSSSNAGNVILVNGAQAKNVFWVVAGATQIGTYTDFNGNILDHTSIAVQTGATFTGKALAQTAVTLDANTFVTDPAPVTLGAAAGPTVTSAATNAAGTVITVTFNKAMTSPAGNVENFTYKINNAVTGTFGAAALNGTTSIDLTALSTPIASGDTINVSYSAGTVTASDGTLLADFDHTVTNTMPTAPTVTSAATNAAGTVITVTFDKAMSSPAGNFENFTYKINGAGPQLAFSAAALNSTPTKIDLTTSGTPIAYGDTVNVSYTAGTVTSSDGVLLADFDHAVTNTMPAPPGSSVPVSGNATTVDLGTAGNFAILAKSGISTTTGTQATQIVGNIGVSPIAATAITGFGLVMDPSYQFSKSSLVTTGNVYAADYALPTPGTMTTAVNDMQAAYTAANAQAPDVTGLNAGLITDGTTLTPGVYKWSTGVTIPAHLTLDAQGNSSAVWVFQIAGVLSSDVNSHVILANGTNAQNVYWVVAGNTALGANSELNGNILDQTGITFGDNATLNGRALAQTDVTLIGDTVNGPAAAATLPEATPGATVNATTVALGTAGNFAILAKSGITTTGTSAIDGNIGVSPIAASSMTGFGLTLDSSGQFSTSSQVTGNVYAADYAAPTPATMTSAVSYMEAAYTAANAQAAGVAELGAGNISGMTLIPGVYKWSTGVTIPGSVTLDAQNNPNAVWVFQTTGVLSTGVNSQVILANGAQAQNVYWVVAGNTALGANSTFNGNILDQTYIALNDGATLNGRALAQTAVTLIGDTVNGPTATATPPTTTVSGGTTTPTTVDLGTAGNFVILAKSGITTTGTTNSTIIGNIGVSPIAASSMTGFGLVLDASGQFSTSPLVSGNVYAADYAAPTPATMTTAVSAMEAAYTAANALTPGVTELGNGSINGMTLAPGVYKWTTGVTIPNTLTLDAQGNSNAVWVFQTTGVLSTGVNSQIILANGANADNVYWVVAGNTALGANSTFNGNILDQTYIALGNGATLNGRALAQTAVTLISDTVTGPTAATYAPASPSGSGSQITTAIISGATTTLDFSTTANTTITFTTNNSVDAGTPVNVTAYTRPPVTGMPLPAFTAVGRYITISAPALESNVSSVIISMHYDPATLPAGVTEANLVIEYFNVATQSWESLPSTVDTVNHIVSATSTHFSTYGLFAGASAVDLGTAGNYVILTETGVTTTPGTQNTLITGDIGADIVSSAITGFSLANDSSGQFSTSSLVNGKVYAADYTAPTPANLNTAVLDMQAAYTAANAQTPGITDLDTGTITDGTTLTPGVYKWTTGVTIPNTLTLDAQGNANAVWVFQVTGVLSSDVGSKVVLANGAQAQNVYWVVSGNTALGTDSTFNGIILDQTYIALNDGVTFNGQALAQTQVTLIGDTVAVPVTAAAPGNSGSSSSSSSVDNGNSGGSSGGGGSGGGSSVYFPAVVAPGQAPGSALPQNILVPAVAPVASGQKAPVLTPAAATSAPTTSTGGLPLMGIAGVVVVLAIIGVAVLLFTRRHP